MKKTNEVANEVATINATFQLLDILVANPCDAWEQLPDEFQEKIIIIFELEQ